MTEAIAVRSARGASPKPPSRDVREGGSWTPAQRAKNDVVYAAVAASLAIAGALPRPLLPALGRGIGLVAHALLGRARRLALRNVAACFPALSRKEHARLVRDTFLTLGANLGDTIALLARDEPAAEGLVLPDASKTALETALGRGRGVVYVTGHLGPWERMAALLAARGFPITTVARESYDPRFDRLYDRLRKTRAVEALYRGKPGAPVAIVRALARGRIVGFPMDLPGRVPTIPVTLLGLPSRLPVGPARIALRTRAAVVVGTPAPPPCSARSEPASRGPLALRIEPLATDDLAPGAPGEATLTQRMADALGERIAALPAHWPWMHPSFDDAPAHSALPVSAGSR